MTPPQLPWLIGGPCHGKKFLVPDGITRVQVMPDPSAELYDRHRQLIGEAAPDPPAVYEDGVIAGPMGASPIRVFVWEHFDRRHAEMRVWSMLVDRALQPTEGSS